MATFEIRYDATEEWKMAGVNWVEFSVQAEDEAAARELGVIAAENGSDVISYRNERGVQPVSVREV